MDSIGSYQGIFNQSSITTDVSELIITGLIDNKVIGSIGGILTNNVSTDGLDEGKTNLYYTDSRARGAFSGGTGVSIVSGVIAIGQDVGTSSSPTFAGLTLGTLSGVLKATAGVLSTSATTDDLSEGKTNLYYTTTRARGAFSAGTNITLSLAGVIATSLTPSFTSATIGTLNITSMNSNITSGVSLGTGAGTAGSYNAYIGTQAGTSATGGSNVGIGYQALASCTGSNCFGLGFTAGYNMKTSGNVCIGSSTGQNLLTGSGYNIYIGSGNPSSSSASYEIVIGGNPAGITGKGDNTCFISANSGLYVSNLSAGVLKSSSTGLITSNATTDDLTEGKTNLYFTTGRARAVYTATAPIFIVSGIVSIGYNTSNLKLTGSNLDTIQDIQTTSGPQFAYLALSSVGNQNIAYTDNTNLSSSGAGGNCILGALSGKSITTGGKNISLGLGSLSGAITPLTNSDGQNIGIGTGSLSVLQGIAQYNLAVGAYAGQNLTTANYNIFYGAYAGNSITTSSNNIAIGRNAIGLGGTKLTIADGQNVAIGNYASYTLNGTSANNITVGYNALYAGTTATNNTIVGANSSIASTTASNNTVIGQNSMNANTTGSYNTIIGQNSGQVLNGGMYNIHIGVGCQASALNASSEIIIAGTSGTTVGKGAGTCYISSPYGLYSYIPAFWWGYAQYTVGTTIRWNTKNNVGIVLNPANDTQILCPTPGLYEFTLSGSVFCNATSVINMNMNVNGSVYLAGPAYYSGFIGWRAISVNCFVVVTNTTTYITYTMGTGMETSVSAPCILTAKFISL
jgi:hypothetical protein